MKQISLTIAMVSLLGGALQAQVVVSAPQPPELPKHSSHVTVNMPKITMEIPKMPSMPEMNSIQDDQDGPMRSKAFTKSFSLDNSDKVSLSNRYGSMLIKTWDKKEIKVDVEIKGYSNTEDEAQKLIDEVSIDAAKTGDQITFKTVMKERGNYGRNIVNGKVKWRRELKINYVVYMPASIALTASQQYGPMTVPAFSAPTSLKVQYGNLNAESLNNVNNYVNVQYGNINIETLNKGVIKQQYGAAATIGTANSIDLNVQYAGARINTVKGNAVVNLQYGSGLTLGSVNDLELSAQYAKSRITAINGNATIKQQYGGLNLETIAGDLNLNGQYANVSIGTLKGNGDFRVQYDRLTIDQVGSGNKSLNVRSGYVTVNIGFASGYNGSVDVDTDYSGFKNLGRGNITQVKDADDRRYSSKKIYTGKIGNGGSGTVKISADYGSVTFK